MYTICFIAPEYCLLILSIYSKGTPIFGLLSSSDFFSPSSFEVKRYSSKSKVETNLAVGSRQKYKIRI